MNPRLFIGVFPTGLSYADRTIERDGDYKRLAFLPFRTLRLQLAIDCPADLRTEIEQDATAMQARRGEDFEVSTCGQTVVLGLTIETPNTSHAYGVEAQRGDLRRTFDVHANNRNSAAARVRALGWDVRSVNMTG